MKLASVLALALAVSPPAHAHAPGTCQDIQSLVDLAFEDFASIKGKKTIYDARSYVAAIDLFRVDECVVRDAPVVVYECSWTYDSLDSLSAAHESLLATIGACLSDWQLVPEKKKIQGTDNYEVTTFGATFRGNGRNEAVSVKTRGIESIQPGISMRVLRFSVSLNASRKIA